MAVLKRLFTFLNLLDYQGNLSLTNLALIAALANSFITQSFTSSIIILITVANYLHKRKVNNDAPRESELKLNVDSLNSKVDDIATQVTALAFKSKL